MQNLRQLILEIYLNPTNLFQWCTKSRVHIGNHSTSSARHVDSAQLSWPQFWRAISVHYGCFSNMETSVSCVMCRANSCISWTHVSAWNAQLSRLTSTAWEGQEKLIETAWKLVQFAERNRSTSVVRQQDQCEIVRNSFISFYFP